MPDSPDIPTGVTTASLPSGQVQVTVCAGGGPVGFLVMDSFCLGFSRGGVRLCPDVTLEEVGLLAAAMSAKFGLLGLPQGGAKAGLLGDPDAPRAERLAALVRFLAPLQPLLASRVFLPGPDMGTDNDLMREALVAVGAPPQARELRGTRSGYYTALTVFHAARHGASFCGLPWPGASAIVEGFGHVGRPLARLLAQSGVRLDGVSTSRGALYCSGGLDVAVLEQSADRHGSAFVLDFPGLCPIPPQELLTRPCDFLFPCARHRSIAAPLAASLQSKVIAAGANHPWDPDVDAALFARGIVALPDFLTNCGGVIGDTLRFAGWPDSDIDAYLDRRMAEHVPALLARSRQSGHTPASILLPLALERGRRVAREAAGSGVVARARRAAAGAYRRGWIPPALFRRLTRSYFEESVFAPFPALAAPFSATTAVK